MAYVAKISRSGHDVHTADKRYLILDTEQNIFKEKDSGDGTVGGSATATIAHSLGYQPHFIVWIERTSGSNDMVLLDCAAARHFAFAYADATNLYIKNLVGGGARKYYYYIFYDAM